MVAAILLGTHAYAQAPATQGKTLKVRVMSYNLRFGELASLEALAAHIKAFKPDFVALQEVDCNTHRGGVEHQHGKNFVNELAYHTGMFGLYGKTINFSGGYYGIGILSRHPYISVQKTLLPHREKGSEQRAVLEGLFELGGDTIVFASTHLDHKNSETRLLQAKTLTEHFADAPYPIVIGGDFNAEPTSKEIKLMERNWLADTNPQSTCPTTPEPTARIDYVFARPAAGWKVIRSQAIPSRLSDHLPIITDLEYCPAGR